MKEHKTDGKLTPSLILEITENQPVMFEHHTMSWKTPSLNTVSSKWNRRFKRAIAGMPIILLETSGHGTISLSRHSVGHIFEMKLQPGQTLDVREHQYVAATANLDYSFNHTVNVPGVTFGGTGFFIDHFKATDGEGTVWLHSYGDAVEIELAEGEQIDIDSGSWIYKDSTVEIENIKDCYATGLASSHCLIYKRVTGPGRIGMQTISLTMAQDSSLITRGRKGLLGALFGFLARRSSK